MCKALKLPRSSFYYKETPKAADAGLENAVIEEFRKSRKNYGARKLRAALKRRGMAASRRRIGEIMKKYGLVSSYTLRQSKKSGGGAVNDEKTGNIVNREFGGREKYEVAVSDLTYVKIGGKWHYLCLLLDLCGRKILGSAVGSRKDAKLVETAFHSVRADLRQIGLFHTDRGSEFKNLAIGRVLKAFGIKRSLSRKGSPHDNAVAESMYNVVKTEFVFGRKYADLTEFRLLWADYVNWYNNVRLHGSLGYMTPNEWHSSA